MTAEAQAFFLLTACDFDVGRREAGRGSGRNRERGKMGQPKPWSKQPPGMRGDYRSLHCGPLNPKNTSRAAVPEKYSEGSLLIVPLPTENWFRFSFESVFLEKHWLPLCDKLCSLNTAIVHPVYESCVFLLFIFALFYRIWDTKKSLVTQCYPIVEQINLDVFRQFW